jgi:uncharacterized protein YjiS (DUF1127 family)
MRWRSKNVWRFIRKPIDRGSPPDAGPVGRSATAICQAGARRKATRDRSGICVCIRLAAKRHTADGVGGKPNFRAQSLLHTQSLGRSYRCMDASFAGENGEDLNQMSYVETNSRWPGVAPFAMHVVKAMHSIRMAYLRRRDRMRAHAELSAFDDLWLRDIGISRTGIWAALHSGERDASRHPE